MEYPTDERIGHSGPTISQIMTTGKYVKSARIWGESWNIYRLDRKYYALSPPRSWIATWKGSI